MKRDLLRRMTRLETRFGALDAPKFILLMDGNAQEPCKSLAPGERIVIDWYSDVDGFVLARERITTDPADDGRRCEPTVTWSGRIRWRDS